MSTLKSINWALAWRRGIWTVVWAAMMALLVVMCLDLAANQPVIFGIVMLAAFVGSIGLAYTRISWQNGATGTAVAALAVSLLAICTHAFMEASYWSSVIDQINQEVSAERAVSDARAAVAAKRKERYVSSSNGKSSGQLEAEIKAAEQNALFSRSASCTDATTKDSRDFCQGYFLMQSKLAAAKEAGQLEGMIWSAGTTVETTTKRNLAAIAVMASTVLGGQPEQYTAMIVITLVMFTQALLAFALVIGWAPEKPRTAAQTSPAVVASAAPSSPVLRDPPAILARPERKAYEPTLKLPEFKVDVRKDIGQTEPIAEKASDKSASTLHNSADGTDFDGPGTPIAQPKEEAPAATNVVPIKSYSNAEWRIERETRKKPKKARTQGDAKEWATANLIRDRRDTACHFTGEQLYAAYEAWCDASNITAAGFKPFSAKVAKHLGLPPSKAKGARLKGGRLFPGIRFRDAAARRKVA